MKLYRNLMMTYLVMLAVSGYLFSGCSSGSKQNGPAASTASQKAIDAEDEEEKREPSGEKKEEGGSVFENWKSNKGIGPVKSVDISGAVDQAMAEAGAKIYKEKCASCHKPDKRFIGPAPKGIFERRTPEWVMNMILNPEQMVKEDPIAKQLLMDFNLSPMANQNLTEDEARKVLEYFRTL